MAKKIRITESDIQNIIKQVVNEISYGKVNDAYDEIDNTFENIRYLFTDFYDELMAMDGVDNPYFDEIRKHAEAINDILNKKKGQMNHFNDEMNKFDYEKFYADKGREEDDYDGIDLRTLQKRYPKR